MFPRSEPTPGRCGACPLAPAAVFGVRDRFEVATSIRCGAKGYGPFPIVRNTCEPFSGSPPGVDVPTQRRLEARSWTYFLQLADVTFQVVEELAPMLTLSVWECSNAYVPAVPDFALT